MNQHPDPGTMQGWPGVMGPERPDNTRDEGCPRAGGCRALTFGALDAGVLVVAEEEALPTKALIAAHHVDAGLLAAAVALRALVQVCKRKVVGSECGSRAH